VFGALGAALCGAEQLQRLYQFSFTPEPYEAANFESDASPVTLSGRSPKECDSPLDFTSASVSYVALALTDLGQGCFSGSAYANGDFPIVLGTVRLGSQSFDAFEIRPPEAQASQFVASGQQLYVQLNGSLAHQLYRLEDGALVRLAELQAADGAFVPTGIAVQGLSTASVYLIIPPGDVAPGPTRRTLSGQGVTECEEVFPESEVFGDITLAAMRQGTGNCWTDGRYSNSGFLVEKGALSSADATHAAFRISPPLNKPTEFTASQTKLYVRNAESQTLNVWTHSAAGFELLDTIEAVAGSYVKTSVRVDDLAETLLIVLQPSTTRMSIWPLEAEGVEAAYLAGSGEAFGLTARRFTVPGQPFVPDLHWDNGPGTHAGNYGTYKRFFVVKHADGREGVVWEDFENQAVKLTWLAADFLSSETLELVSLSSLLLVCAAGDDQGDVVLFLGSEGAPSDKTATSSAEVVKFNAAGTELLRKSLPTSAQEMNVYAFSSSGASIAWDTDSGTIGVSLARTMTRASDGLNHQGGIAFILDASTLEMIHNYGQTSGHSFANSLQVSAKDGWYLGMDLGDNYPRGINLWELKAAVPASWKKRLVYKFKTKHGTSPTSPAGTAYPEYTEISGGGQTFYKWSNDNYVYTELAHPGLHEMNDTVLVFFAGEAPPLDNSLVGQALNVARNVGFVKIPRDLTDDAVLSPGAVESGGFYTFGGTWSEQENRGISFLTSKTDAAESVSRLKTAQVNGLILLVWEVWSGTSYKRSEYMVVDQDGAILQPEASLAFPMKLPFADDVHLRSGKAVAYVGSSTKQLVRFEFCTEGCELPAATTTTGADGGDGDNAATSTMADSTSATQASFHISLTLCGLVCSFISLTCF